MSKSRMSCPVTYCFVLTFVSCLLLLSNGHVAPEVINIGAIIDVNSRLGKEEKVAMEIAVQDFNHFSRNRKLSLHFQAPERDSNGAASAAGRFIREKQLKFIIGMERWEEATIVADVGYQFQVPVLSFAEPAITPPLMQQRWPLLVTMNNHRAEQIKCIASLVGLYKWKRVVVIYEDGANGGDSGELTILSENLRNFSSEIEYRLVLPPFSYLTNPKEVLQEKLQKIHELQSQVFIVLQSSPSMLIHLFREAKKMGFVGTDSVWIISDTIPSYIDSFNSSVFASMEGSLAIKPYFAKSSSSYFGFKARFRRTFRAEYPEEDNSDPSYYALKAYDSIRTSTISMNNVTGKDSSAKGLMESILKINFTGLSGEISFREGRLSRPPVLRVVNLLGKQARELDFWTPDSRFSKSLEKEDGTGKTDGRKGLANAVIWPGEISYPYPRGWAMPTVKRQLKIVVPAQTLFQKFVTVDKEENIDGFCIRLFEEVLNILGYSLPYQFIPVNGTYDELIESIHNKTYDAGVGDFTILADRLEKVDFTQPFAESGLSMVVPAKPEGSPWIFMRPFTWKIWIVNGAIMLYTMLIVWLLEHKQNPEYDGPWYDQFGTALWFTSSTFFFAHREKIYSNLARVVVLVWLFLVMILTSSYTASLSSMLTVQRLKPDVTSIDWLRRNNLKVGCDGDSFVKKYLEEVLEFSPDNILTISNEFSYIEEFRNNTIAAAFFELPYQRIFTSDNCKTYIATTPTYRFGGLGFVFQKGSPIAADFSEAILKLSEDGTLKSLEERWFAPSPECSANPTNTDTESLSISSFWGLYLICGATSTICLVLFLMNWLRNYRKHLLDANQSSTSLNVIIDWRQMVRFRKHIFQKEITQHPGTDRMTAQVEDEHDRNSSVRIQVQDLPL